jgi:hypothetical protein
MSALPKSVTLDVVRANEKQRRGLNTLESSGRTCNTFANI